MNAFDETTHIRGVDTEEKVAWWEGTSRVWYHGRLNRAETSVDASFFSTPDALAGGKYTLLQVNNLEKK